MKPEPILSSPHCSCIFRALAIGTAKAVHHMYTSYTSMKQKFVHPESYDFPFQTVSHKLEKTYPLLGSYGNVFAYSYI
jgi:hypothetical protein